MKISNASIKVLLVDDDEVDIKNITYGFKAFHIQNTLIIARNGREAYEFLEKGIKPKLILLDINMPMMNGFEFLKKLRANSLFFDIPVFIITTSVSEKDKEIAKLLNVIHYFTKPLSFDEFFSFYQAIIEY